MWSWSEKVILVTGGVGSIGSALVEALLELPVRAVRVFDHDEYGLWKLGRKLSDERLRFLLGDVRDKTRVEMALRGVDAVYHLAAIKFIDIANYNPIEAVKTNIGGTVNLVECCLVDGPERFVYASTDKAVYPISLYGMSKAVAEKTVLWADSVSDRTRFTAVRFGNVITSRGNVFEIWNEQRRRGESFTLTDYEMRRYFISMNNAVRLLIKACELTEGGDIFLPEAEPVRVVEMLRNIAGGVPVKMEIIGKREDEKLEERLWTDEEEPWVRKICDGIKVIRRLAD